MNPPAQKEREGRKLNLAEYMRKMQPKPIKKPSATRRKVIPDYVIPSEKKRDQVRYDIRMKMIRSSGIDFSSPERASKSKRRSASPDAKPHVT